MFSIISAVIGLIGSLIVGAISVVIQLIPALFQLCILIERFIFMTVAQLTNRLLNIGLLTLISGVLWAAAAALIGTPLLAMYVGSGAAVWLIIAGGVWGIVTGHQAALLEVAEQLRRPGVLTQELPGYLPAASTQSQYSTDKPLEELWSEGVILGEVSREDE